MNKIIFTLAFLASSIAFAGNISCTLSLGEESETVVYDFSDDYAVSTKGVGILSYNITAECDDDQCGLAYDFSDDNDSVENAEMTIPKTGETVSVEYIYNEDEEDEATYTFACNYNN